MMNSSKTRNNQTTQKKVSRSKQNKQICEEKKNWAKELKEPRTRRRSKKTTGIECSKILVKSSHNRVNGNNINQLIFMKRC